jgi:shikimate kinase
MKFYLIGFMGSGKSRLSNELSKLTDLSCIDIDKQIVENYGISISEIFSQKGELYFRKLEKDFIRATVNIADGIIAAGGGSPMFFDNMEFMRREGVTIYLKADKDLLVRRLMRNKLHRPAVLNLDETALKTFVQNKLNEREATYNTAKYIVKISDNLQKNIDRISEIIKSEMIGC